ncbi:hypothetical protein M1N22_02005 [Dehalococcoidia bacterium]|nr:hypothetical protein [Dehalococcoidia bacterium]MCL0064599.1 hypothetical protein [Dehalococcoidia bacterium]
MSPRKKIVKHKIDEPEMNQERIADHLTKLTNERPIIDQRGYYRKRADGIVLRYIQGIRKKSNFELGVRQSKGNGRAWKTFL